MPLAGLDLAPREGQLRPAPDGVEGRPVAEPDGVEQRGRLGVGGRVFAGRAPAHPAVRGDGQGLVPFPGLRQAGIGKGEVVGAGGDQGARLARPGDGEAVVEEVADLPHVVRGIHHHGDEARRETLGDDNPHLAGTLRPAGLPSQDAGVPPHGADGVAQPVGPLPVARRRRASSSRRRGRSRDWPWPSPPSTARSRALEYWVSVRNWAWSRPWGVPNCVSFRPRAAARAFICSTKASTDPPRCSARTMAASLAELSIEPVEQVEDGDALALDQVHGRLADGGGPPADDRRFAEAPALDREQAGHQLGRRGHLTALGWELLEQRPPAGRRPGRRRSWPGSPAERGAVRRLRRRRRRQIRRGASPRDRSSPAGPARTRGAAGGGGAWRERPPGCSRCIRRPAVEPKDGAGSCTGRTRRTRRRTRALYRR